jgi:O-antigen/teichoic acid export membrane protein
MRPARLRPWSVSAPTVLRDVTWITAGSVVGAIGTILGLRLITEVTPAETFGNFVLANGLVALCSGVALHPVAQAALRFYPDLERTGSAASLRDVMAAELLRRLVWLFGPFALAALLDTWLQGWLSVGAWAALVAVLFLDAAKTIEVVLRNASGDQAGYAALGAADAVVRPLGAAGCAWLAGPSVESLLWGQWVAGVAIVAFFVARLPRPAFGSEHSWRRDLRAYAAPLAWTPVLGWVLSLADRYVIASFLGSAAAGIYAAGYGLVSRPMLMLGGIADATLRQRLYGAVARGDGKGKRRVQIAWLGANVGLGLFVALVLVGSGEWIVGIVLAEAFRAPVLPLLLPLALGHVLILAYQATIRRLYAAGRTREVVLVDGVAGATAVGGACLGALVGGVNGVAWAMPGYASVQVMLALAVAGRSR